MGVNMNTKTHTLYHVQLVLETAIVIIMSQRSNEMTREDIFKLLNKHQDNDTLDIKTAKEMVNIIYNDHEVQLKQRDKEIERLKVSVKQWQQNFLDA